MKTRTKRIQITITAQTLYHLKEMAEESGLEDIGRVIDKLVRERQIATKIRIEPTKKGR